MMMTSNTSSTSSTSTPSVGAPSATHESAAQIFFRQAESAALHDCARFMVPSDDGEWAPISWGEALARVERVAAFLVGREVPEHTSVAVLGDTRVEWALCGLAVQAARCVLVPVYPTLVGDALSHLLDHSDARVLVVERAEHLARALPLLRASGALTRVETIITIDRVDAPGIFGDDTELAATLQQRVFSLAEVEARGAAELVRDGDAVRRRVRAAVDSDVSCLIYTSGTTGLPKGVPLTNRNLGANGADWVALNSARLRDGDVDLLWLPLSHIFGWGELCLGNQLGWTSYFSDPKRALADLPRVRPHIFMSVPVYWEKLALQARAAAADAADQDAALQELTGGRLRFCLSGGAGLSRAVKDRFALAGMLIIEGYGLTECSPTLTLNRVDDYDFDTVGKPVPSVELRLADDGEILARGPNVFSGYYKDPVSTAGVFTDDGWLRTGDLGRFTDRGFLQIIGRKKEILVTAGGKNVAPVNIEQRFVNDPVVAHVVVYGDGKKYLTALVDIDDAAARAELALPSGGSATLRAHPALRDYVAARVAEINAELARYETIKAFAIADQPLTVESGMLTASLKLRRKAIYERYGAALEALYA